jgi:hypothetical protein
MTMDPIPTPGALLGCIGGQVSIDAGNLSSDLFSLELSVALKCQDIETRKRHRRVIVDYTSHRDFLSSLFFVQTSV